MYENYSFNLSKDGKIENIMCETFIRSNNDIANNIAIELLKEEFIKLILINLN